MRKWGRWRQTISFWRGCTEGQGSRTSSESYVRVLSSGSVSQSTTRTFFLSKTLNRDMRHVQVALWIWPRYGLHLDGKRAASPVIERRLLILISGDAFVGEDD